MKCGIIDCVSVEFENEECLQRHILFHSFHAGRQLAGLIAIGKRNDMTTIVDCGSIPNSITYNGQMLTCLWDECLVRGKMSG